MDNYKTTNSLADWSRETPRRFWDPSRKLILTIREYQTSQSRIVKKIAVVRHRFWSVICAADIPLNSDIAGGLMLPHPTGVVIHPESKIGANCYVSQNVTIGDKRGTPVIEENVFIGPGAKIFGPIRIGRYSQIGANAVVINDVPAYHTAVGVPAKVIFKAKQRDRN